MPKKITLLDGGMGQELIKRSGATPTPLWSTRVMLDTPKLVEDLHLDFINAGAEIISLNNYTATPPRLTRDATIDLFHPIHAKAIEVAHRARDRASRSVRVAGCLPPLIASYNTDLAPEFDECLSIYRQLVDIQDAGVDLFFCETISTVREAMAAAQAGLESGKAVWMSFSLDDDQPLQLRSGEALQTSMEAVAALGVEAIMVNCSAPETVNDAVKTLVSGFPKTGAYANGFQSVTPLGVGGTVIGLKARTDLTPDRYADYAMGWVEAGVKIIGGCCEVGPDHIAELSRRIGEL